jgi:WhiB family redox-sensing transcriptional regulator
VPRNSVDVPSPAEVMGHDGHTWRAQAACRGAAAGLFFPDGHQPGYRAQVAEVKAVCSGCPVREQCRAWALAHPAERGVWGGLTEADRRRLRKARRQAA